MKKHFFIFILVVFNFFIFTNCNLLDINDADDKDSFPIVDFSSFITNDEIYFPEKTDSLHIFNCLYSIYGYGEFNCVGQYSHTENAKLNGKNYSDTVTYDINKITIYKYQTELTSSFFVIFYTNNNLSFTYCYKWQHSNTNAWENTELNGIIILQKEFPLQ